MPNRRINSRWMVAVGLMVAVVVAAAWWIGKDSLDEQRVWTIGSDDTIPYHYLVDAANGEKAARGMVGELIAEAARRRKIKLVWSRRQVEDLDEGKVDLWPLNTLRPRPNGVGITRPLMRNAYVWLLPRQPGAPLPTLDGVDRILVWGKSATVLTEQLRPKAKRIKLNSREESLAALCRGEGDAFIVEARPLQSMLLNQPEDCRGLDFHTVGLGIPPFAVGIGYQGYAKAVANALRDEIDRMLADGSAQEILRNWSLYGSGEVELLFRETQARRGNLITMWLAIALLAATIVLILLWRAARAAAEAKSQFLATMSHEIRTPLNGVIGLAEVLEQSSLDHSQRHLLANLQSSGRNLLAIVNNVLDLARIESGALKLEPESIPLAPFLEDLVTPFRLRAEAKGLSFEVHGLHQAATCIEADPVRLRQLLGNLLSNAVKFTEKGKVWVSVATDSHRGVTFTVGDTGIGIPQAAQRRLFQKFYQAGSDIARRFGGTGLGLAIVRELTRAMGGKVSMESRMNEGSVFVVSLPLDIPSAPTPVATPAEAPQLSGRILIVEDNAVNQLVAKRLVQQLGCEAHVALSGEEALDLCQVESFDLILMDCQMPGLDGYETTRELRRRQYPTPIIALTASVLAGERERCLATGMNDFLTKPITRVALAEMLKRWLQPVRS